MTAIDMFAPQARVIYRGTVLDGREAELHLTMDPDQATVADAWERLRLIHADIDPRSLEIEVRRGSPRGPVRSNEGPGLAIRGR